MIGRRPRVLLVCVKNSGKSQMAAGLMNQLANVPLVGRPFRAENGALTAR